MTSIDVDKMAAFLSDQSVEQLGELAGVILQIQVQKEFNEVEPFLIQAQKEFDLESFEDAFLQASMPKKPKTAAASRNKSSKGGNKVAALKIVAKRPLNSWMAFRAFYAPIFSKFQQKDISGLLTRMWKEDPFKAKWAVVAKAYSVIRDKVGKAQAPLDIFLQIVYEHIGLVAPADYLPLMGWAISSVQAKDLIRFMFVTTDMLPADLLTTNVSADDLIVYCHQIGYGVYDFKPNAASDQATLTMVSAPDMTAPDTVKAAVQASDEEGMQIQHFELNDDALEYSDDQFPYNDQFDSEENDADLGLWVNMMAQSQLPAFDLDMDTCMNFDEAMGDNFAGDNFAGDNFATGLTPVNSSFPDIE